MKHLFLFIILAFSLSLTAQSTRYICAGSTATFTIVPDAGQCQSPATYSYTWTSPSNITTTGISVTTSESGLWTGNWTCSAFPGCTGTLTVNLIVEPDPTSAITINATNSCVGANQTISATGVPSGYTYSWDFGTDATPATSTSSSASVNYSTTGTKTITLTISKDFTGCSPVTCTWTKTTTITISNLTGTVSCS